MKTKKLLSVTLAASLAMTAFASSAITASAAVSWSFDNKTGTLIISGSGAMENMKKVLVNECDGDIKTVVIEHGITSIGEGVFDSCKALESITVPSSVTSVGDDAFYGCTSLKSVTFPSALKSIGIRAFCECESLESVTFEGGVESIGGNAFTSCTKLKNLSLPSNLKSIGQYAFYDCTSLERIHYSGEAYQWKYVSKGDNWKDDSAALFVTVTAAISCSFDDKTGVLIISGSGAMENMKNRLVNECDGDIKTVVIEPGITSIGEGVFDSCSALESITIPSSVTSVGDDAFYGCTSLKSVTFPSALKSIGIRAFCDCASLESVTFEGGVESIGENAFTSCTKLKNLSLPSNLKSIGQYAFYDCASLESITIPASVTSIGKSAFESCDSLTSIYYVGDAKQWDDVSKGDNWKDDSAVMYTAAAAVTSDGVTTKYISFTDAAAAWAQTENGKLTVLADYELTKDFAVPANHTLDIAEGVSVGGTGSIDNKGTIDINGTLDSSKGTIVEAGTVNVLQTGNLIITAELPKKGNVIVVAGGKLSVSTEQGTAPFIGTADDAAIVYGRRGATLDNGYIVFALSEDINSYTLNGDMTVYGWDTENSMFGNAAKLLANNGTMTIPQRGTMTIGSNTTLKNNKNIIIQGTLDASKGKIEAAGNVSVENTGKLVIASALPETGNIQVYAGGEVDVAVGETNMPFIGDKDNTAIQTAKRGVTIDAGLITFALTSGTDTYTLDGIMTVYGWDTGNSIFDSATKELVNSGTMNVAGSLVINDNSTLKNYGTIALTDADATVSVKEDAKGDLVVKNSDGGVNSDGTTVYSGTIDAMAIYRQEGEDYTSETETNNVASLWSISVKLGTNSIKTLDVKLGNITSKEGAQTLDTPAMTDGIIALGVVTNLSSEGVDEKGGFTVVADGKDIQTFRVGEADIVEVNSPIIGE